jgi:hypothetical protein
VLKNKFRIDYQSNYRVLVLYLGHIASGLFKTQTKQ